MPIYMKYDGIDGEVTTKGYEKWIELHSAQFGNGRAIAMPTGRGASREAGNVNMSEVVVTKGFDAASQKLFEASLTGTGKEVKIHYMQSKEGGGGATLQPYLELTLTNTLISSYSTSSGGDKPMESLSLNFTKIAFRQIAYDDKNKPISPVTTTFDLATTATS